MVNRELIRVKLIQLVYAYYMSGGKSLDIAMREVQTSLAKANDLYYFLLSLIVSITREVKSRYAVRCQRARREGRALPSGRFAENKFAAQLSQNEQLLSFIDTHKHDWSEDIEFVRRLCDLIEQLPLYTDYLSAPSASYADDRELWRRIYKSLIVDNDELDAILEEQSLYWNDDKTIVDTFIMKTIKRFDEANGAQQDLLPDYKDPMDEEFALSLFCATVENRDSYLAYLESASANWDISRMAFTDIIIMQMAIAEMVTFAEIPLSVTINEYVELSKVYSTPKSGTFINAMLDTIARRLFAEGKIMKQLQ